MPPEITSRRLVEQTSQRKQSVSPETSDQPITTSLRLHIICVVLCLFAAFIFTLTEHDDHQHTFWCVFEIAMQTVLVIVATAYFRMRIQLLHQSTVIMPMLVMIACLSLICEPIQRMLFGTGHAFEMLVMHSQCNLMLALAVCGFRMSFQRLAVIIAVFMTIFCCTISNARGLIPLTIVFAVVAVTWLVASWWETVDRRLLKTERQGLPKLWLATAAGLPLLALLSAGAFGSNTVTTALKGFMPSSGGTGQYDPYSRGGVNDGDALVAGNNDIKSFGPLEDAPFVESEKPSLYDVVNDTFDEPPRKVKKQERAISLPAELMKHIHRMMAEAKQAGREFSMLRSKKRGNKRRIKDLNTHALFYVAGRTPVHLKTEVYELFDGIDWAPLMDRENVANLKLKDVEGRDWLQIPAAGTGFEMFDGSATHSLKVAHLDGNTIPTPAHAIGASIDLVDRADMYVVSHAGIVSLRRESVPSMTPINFVSRCVDRTRLSESDTISGVRRTNVRSIGDVTFYVPEGDDFDRVYELSERVVGDLPRGWPQIEAIEKHLRENYVLDRESPASEDADSPIFEFLFETRRGREYSFACAATVMLRSLGYPARLVNGFYARPERYDELKKHTAVLAKDVHFWCEVCIGADTWLTVEPSPGYHVLLPPPGLAERLWTSIKQMVLLAVDNAFSLTLLAIVIVTGFLSRKTLQERLLTLRWKLASRSGSSRRAVHLATLIDHRLRLAGLERHTATTLKRWARQAELKPVQSDLTRVADIADHAMYAPDIEQDVDSGELDELEASLSYRQLRQLKKQSTQSRKQTQAV